jgi:Zn-dependent protease with chaperone function
MLLAGLTALFMAVGYLIGGPEGMVIAFAIAVAMNLFSYWRSDGLVLTMHGAQEVDERTAPEFKGRMIGGFGLVAWPARFGDSGIMTFIVNQDGVVYQKDLGPQTAKVAPMISRFDPDQSWQKAEP